MGNILVDNNHKIQRNEDENSEIDLWYTLVEYVSLYLPAGIVMSWDREEVKKLVLDITNIDTDKHWDLRTAAPKEFEPIDNLPELTPDIAMKLLEIDPKLQKLRFKLVPARIKEKEFWHQYFERIVDAIRSHVMRAQK